jgi:hypothetical protein
MLRARRARAPAAVPGQPGRETHEREAALGAATPSPATPSSCARQSFRACARTALETLVAENVRDHAIFLLDVNGIIECWGESARG